MPVDLKGRHASEEPALSVLTSRRPVDPYRRPADRLDRLFEELCDRPDSGSRPAVDAGDEVLSYRDLDRGANRLARHLLDQGVRPGDRVALLLDRPVDAYLGMVATAKAGATYVPLDPGFPAERIGYILGDARVGVVLTTAEAGRRVDGLAGALGESGARALRLDEDAERIARHRPDRLAQPERDDPSDELAYIIYTSGSTGRPKGVAVEHASICAFIRAAADVYGIRPDDRMYQGMTIAFDFSVEETWVPWAAGATLVPKPSGGTLVGAELGEFLAARHVSALCCVPTLLATLDHELPDLRFLLVSGEACPQHLISRWHRPGRRFLNVYGPTETTVTATYTELHPERPVTIGAPLPGYTIAILDPHDPGRALPAGEIGEIGIAGVGLARGYVNRPDQTRGAFIRDHLGAPDNPTGRIYRTGDLGRITVDGEIAYHGRVDRQVKIRGYRIELPEIESVLLAEPGIAAAVVDTYEPEAGDVELVAYYCPTTLGTSLDVDRIQRRLRDSLPAYMVPAYYEQLAAIPMTTSDKVDRGRLPTPTRRHTAPSDEHVAPATETERVLAGTLAETLDMENVSVTAHIFSELGASSLLVARFAARVRELDACTLSVRDIYRNPTVRALARALPREKSRTAQVRHAEGGEGYRPARVGYLLTGLAQLLMFLAAAGVAGLLLDQGYRWVSTARTWPGLYGRGAVFSAAVFVALCALPIAAKWALVGRWRATELPLWGLAYLRFWVVRVLVRVNPLVLFVGSPVYTLYLRALGTKIGRDVVVFAPPPVATDLVSIGDGTVVRQRCTMTGYRALAGRIQTGPVSLGRNVMVAENTVLDIDTAMGDGSRLGHASALHAGQRVTGGQSWHGSPAEPAEVDYQRVPPARPGRLRKIGFTLFQLGGLCLALGLVFGSMVLALREVPVLADVLGPGAPYLVTPTFYLTIAAATATLCVVGVVVTTLVMITVPRLLPLVVRPGKVYPLYGFVYIAATVLEAMTNSRFLVLLFGDSSFIAHFARAVGYDLSRLVQTGSNFGTGHRHDSPYLTSVGSGTMISDGLAVMNAEYSSTSFRLNPVRIGAHNFLGNNIAFPSGARVGDNCLLATKTMVPIDGPRREDVGLLGSPAFEIPRHTVTPGRGAARLPATERERRRRLRAKNSYNARTIAVVLAARSVWLFLAVLPLAAAADLWAQFGAWALAAAIAITPPVLLGYTAVLERAAVRFGSLAPRFCTIYHPDFWRHERLWKFYVVPPLPGTPFQNLVSRLAGLRVGRRVFDDGCAIPEKTLVSIGDDAVLNVGSVIQCHSLEDGYFRSDRITIGHRAALGVNAFVHYGVDIADAAELAADSYLLKGERVGSGEHWRGNPAGPAGASPWPLGAVPARRYTHPRPAGWHRRRVA